MTVLDRHEFKWYGKENVEKVLAAAVIGIDYTMAKCVMWAKYHHDYEDRTGHMTQSLTILDLAKVDLLCVRGSWGANASYSLYLEIGTSRPWSAAPRAEVRAELGHGDMWAVPPPLPSGPHTDTYWYQSGGRKFKVPGGGPLMEPRMSMRPAAAIEYPKLADRIGKAFRGESLE